MGGTRETAATWAKRVQEWKASGETSDAFSVGRGFSAGGLRHWAYRLRLTKRRRPERADLRVVRVERVPAPAAPAGVAAQHLAVALHVEVGGARVAVMPGFDRATLGAIVDVLGERQRSGR